MVDVSEKNNNSSVLNFKLPPRQNENKLLFASSKEADQWFQNLPVASTGETAKHLYKALHSLNRTHLENHLRAEIIDKFRQPIHTVTNNLQRYYIGAKFPLTDKSRKVALLTREMFAELAIAYKILITELASATDDTSPPELLITSLQRTLYYLSRILLISSLIYESWPVGIWQEIHRIFAYASRNRIEHLSINDPLLGSQQEITLNSLYKQILLFAIASPYQMPQRDMLDLDKFLPDWVNKTRLLAISGDDMGEEHCFVINLWSDTPPVHSSLFPDKSSKNRIVINTENLLVYMSHDLIHPEIPQPKTETLEISRGLREILHKNWSGAPHRKFPRTHMNFDLNLAIGLQAIHESLLYQQLQTRQMNQPAHETWQNPSIEEFSSENMELALHNNDNSGHAYFVDDSVMAQPSTLSFTTTETQTEKKQLLKPCQTVNESTGGYCVRWDHPQSHGIKIGELIGIQSASSSSLFSLSQVRWIKNIPGSSLLIGMQTFSPNSQAVHVRLSQELPKHKQHEWYIGLLPDYDNKQHAHEIILPSDLFPLGTLLVLQMTQGNTYKIQLQILLESTGSFSHYQILMPEKQPDMDDTDAQNDMDNSFDNIWSSI